MRGARILMTLDAVGGVWRYAMDLAAGLSDGGAEIVFAGFGPAPDATQRREAEARGTLHWLDAALDWMVPDATALSEVPGLIADLARREGADLLHLNLPSQAAGLVTDLPVLVVSHSCVATWFRAVKGSGLPQDWEWQGRLNRAGFARADAVVAPSQSHADLLTQCYGPVPQMRVVHNATRTPSRDVGGGAFALAIGRWWDEGKNAALLDRAARAADWPVVMVGATRSATGQVQQLHHAEARGEVPHEEAMALMARAGIYVAPSLYEPFGLAVAEAARMALPLALADIPTFRELWDGAALFFDPRDADGLARAINRLSADADLRRRMGAAAQARSLRFSLSTHVTAMEGLYSRLLPVPQQIAAMR